MYEHKRKYVHAPTLDAATLNVFMVWLQAWLYLNV